MTVSGIQPTSAPATASAARKPTTNLGKDDFLKLLAGQLQHQDPMSAKGGEEFMGQMTQFAMLEQIQNMAAAQLQATTAAASTQAVSLIGKQVSYEPEGGGPTATAPVERVVFQDGTPKLLLAGVERPLRLGDVREVA